MYTDFYVDKTTLTFADTLVAFGLARILDDLLRQQDQQMAEVVWYDRGAYYHIICASALESTTLDGLVAVPLCPIKAIRTPKNADKLPPDLEFLDYESEKEQTNQHYAALKAGVAEDERPPKPRHWDALRAINPAALPGYNSLVENWWAIRHAQPQVVALLLDLYSSTPNNFDVAIDVWKSLDSAYRWRIDPLATCQQLYNPDQGKGQNKSKADGLSIGNIKSFWLSEWLKAVGFYEAAITRLVSGVKDRKTFVVCPRELSFYDSRAVMSRFLDTVTSEKSTRFDILASIRYTRALLEHLGATQSGLAQLLKLKNIKRKVVSGFQTAFYKDLGNAVATMNVSFIALPGWVEIETPDDVQVYLLLLAELAQITRQFDEAHSDAFTLLQHLRDFVSGDDLTAFFSFTNAFAAYYMGKREQNKYAYQLKTWFLERLVMSTDKRLSLILENDGFQNVAYAIRQSTVTAQYRKKQGDRKYDVRYGLGQDLARKARYPDAFISALSDFLHKYNAENAQIMETRSGPYRRSIKTSDIDDIVHLIDEFGSETVANLLIAYGYARVAREDDVPEEEND